MLSNLKNNNNNNNNNYYIKTLFSRFDIKDIYKRIISIDPHTNFIKFDGKVTINKKKIYSSTISDIDWAAIISRSDFTHSHDKLARYVTNPGFEQFK